MKRILLLTAIVPLLFTSCVKDPYADFTVDTTVAEVGETVRFSNRSVDAVDYEWDFDDGVYATTFNAYHSWINPGMYQVRLNAFNRRGDADIALMNIEVFYYCDLEITVEEYEEPFYLVEDISVRLYPTVIDWENETNMIVEGFTGANGKVLFLDVPIPYHNNRIYVDVWGPNHDNYQLAAEDASWIETGQLVPNVRNFFTAVVDYYPAGKKSGTSRKMLKIERKKEAEGKEIRSVEMRQDVNKGQQTVR